MIRYDVVIVGGGIVGLAAGLALSERYPDARLLVLEKESDWACHQTGHNSGVIHSGIYYAPGSLKARLACEGQRSMAAFCRAHGIVHEICGKVIVATEEEEMPRLENLHRRGLENGLKIRRIGPEDLREIEPHVRGIAALHVESTGIVDYRQVARTLAHLLEERGVTLHLNVCVENVGQSPEEIVVETTRTTYRAGFLVGCAGLHSDRLARLTGARLDVQIVPFRGEYYTLTHEKRGLVRHLIYPVPDPNFPFLGVHFTRMVDGEVHAGPNAVLSLKREGYRKPDVDPADLAEILTFPGFWRLAGRHWRMGAYETIRSFHKAAFVRSLQRLIPEIRAEDLTPATSGVRAQAVLRDGRLVDDFLIVPGPRSLHVCNAPSPAATASLEIGRYIADQVSLFR